VDYLDTLPLTEAEKKKLRTLSMNPDELYELIGSTPKTFEKFFGKDRTFHLIRFLFPLVSK